MGGNLSTSVRTSSRVVKNTAGSGSFGPCKDLDGVEMLREETKREADEEVSASDEQSRESSVMSGDPLYEYVLKVPADLQDICADEAAHKDFKRIISASLVLYSREDSTLTVMSTNPYVKELGDMLGQLHFQNLREKLGQKQEMEPGQNEQQAQTQKRLLKSTYGRPKMKRRCCWNGSNIQPCTTVPAAKNRSLREIAKNLGINVYDLQIRMKSLKTQYTRYCKPSPSGSDPKDLTGRQKWILKNLAFHSTHMKKRPSLTNLTQISDHNRREVSLMKPGDLVRILVDGVYHLRVYISDNMVIRLIVDLVKIFLPTIGVILQLTIAIAKLGCKIYKVIRNNSNDQPLDVAEIIKHVKEAIKSGKGIHNTWKIAIKNWFKYNVLKIEQSISIAKKVLRGKIVRGCAAALSFVTIVVSQTIYRRKVSG